MSKQTEMAGVFNIQVEWLNNKIQCHTEIISNNNIYSKVYSHKKESLWQLVALSLQQSGVYSWQHALLSVERGLLTLDVPGLQKKPGLGVRERVHNLGLGQVHLVARNMDGYSIYTIHTPYIFALWVLPRCILVQLISSVVVI